MFWCRIFNEYRRSYSSNDYVIYLLPYAGLGICSIYLWLSSEYSMFISYTSLNFWTTFAERNFWIGPSDTWVPNLKRISAEPSRRMPMISICDCNIIHVTWILDFILDGCQFSSVLHHIARSGFLWVKEQPSGSLSTGSCLSSDCMYENHRAVARSTSAFHPTIVLSHIPVLEAGRRRLRRAFGQCVSTQLIDIVWRLNENRYITT